MSRVILKERVQIANTNYRLISSRMNYGKVLRKLENQGVTLGYDHLSCN